MKIFISHEHKENFEVSISIELYVQSVKDKFDKILQGNGMFSKPYYKLIYRNIILCDKNVIKYYNICDNDEIWIGKLENYVKSDDIIVEVFLVGLNSGIMWIIASKNDSIENIILRSGNIKIRIIKIFDVNGNIVESNQTIEEIGNDRCKKLFCIYEDNLKYDNDYTFAYCCEIYDNYWIGQIFSNIYYDNGDKTLREYLIKLVNDLKKMLSINDRIYEGLNQEIYFPITLINSGFLFCRDVTDRIIDCLRMEVKLKDKINEFDLLFWRFLDDAIISSLYNFVNSTMDQAFENNKSFFQNMNILNLFQDRNIRSILMRNIIVDSLCIFMNNLRCPDNWKCSMRSWINQILMTKLNKSDQENIVEKQSKSYMATIELLNTKHRRKFSRNTICEVKEAVGTQFGLDENHVICIRPGKSCNPIDNELDDTLVFEVIHELDGNFTPKVIGNGISRIILLENNKTEEKIIIKKPHRKQREIYRDIFIQKKLSSSKLVKLYSKLYFFDGLICVGMEYIQNESLDLYIKRKDLSEKEILKIAYEILIQIKELHKYKIVHCDIKCSNVCIDNKGNAKIIDFGLSREISDKLSGGTFRYCAPEMTKDEPCSYEIDIWAFGMLLVEIVTKNIPFPYLNNCKSIKEIRSMKKYEFKPIISISQEFTQFIEKCLTILPSDRPSAERLLESKLFTEEIIK